jgi:DNA modification methylase
MKKVRRVLKPNGSLWLNMADYTRTKEGAHIQAPEMASITLQQIGWYLISTWIWSRHDDLGRDINNRRRFVKDWEYIYWFIQNPEYYFYENCGTINKTSIIDIPYVQHKGELFLSEYPEEPVNMST